MAVRHRRLLDRPPRRVRPQRARRPRPGKPELRRHAEADRSKTAPQRLGLAAPSAIFAAPMFEDFWITCVTVSAPCGCASWIVRLPIVSCPGAVWMTLSGLHRAGFERHRGGERLQRRARLEEIGDGAVARAARIELAAVVRVVGRQVRHREHFAGRHVEHDDAARLRALRRRRRSSARGRRGTGCARRSRA